MTNEEILKKAIEKAGKVDPSLAIFELELDEYLEEYEPMDGDISCCYWIFYNEFAKAFWGEEVCCVECFMKQVDDERYCSTCGVRFTASWQYRLQQMVLEEEPLKYIEKFL